jgi:hypothetical protein
MEVMTDGPDVPSRQAAARRPRWLHVPLPLLLATGGVALGYHACDHLITLFDLLALAPLFGPLLLALFVLSCALLAWKSPKGKRAYAPLLHFPIVVLVSVLSLMHLPPAGKWLWEQTVLKPRRDVLRDLASRSLVERRVPLDVDGYRFEGVELTNGGVMLYTVLAGGPFASKGIFVSLSPGYRGFSPPEEGEPRSCRSVLPTSVDGLFWFMTRD